MTLAALALPVIPLVALLALYSQTHTLPLLMIFRPLAAGVAGAALLLLATRVVLRPLEQRATGVSLFLLAFIAYPFWNFGRGSSAGLAVSLAYVGAAGLAAVLVARRLRSPWTLVVALVILLPITPSLFVLSARWRSHAHRSSDAIAQIIGNAPAAGVGRSGERRDIYYLVLDGLGRTDVLRDVYGVDAAPYTAALGRAGVVVPPLARSNYSQTDLSLASSLNGQYLDLLAGVMVDELDRRPLHRLIQESGLVRQLRNTGYRLTVIGSDAVMTAWHEQADTCRCAFPRGPTELEFALLVRTPFAAFDLDRLALAGHRSAVLRQIEELTLVPPGTNAEPIFVFAHVLAPHPPFVLARDGSPRLQETYSHMDGDRYQGTAADYIGGYGHQAHFVLHRITKFILQLASRPRPPVIVVVGDHGPGLRMYNEDIGRTDAWERLSIFSAYFASEPASSVSADISPVNALRWAIGNATGARVPLLPNKSYLSTYRRPYKLLEIDPSAAH